MNIIRLLLIGGLVYFAMQQKKEGNRNMILIVTGLLAVCMLSKEGFTVDLTTPVTCTGNVTTQDEVVTVDESCAAIDGGNATDVVTCGEVALPSDQATCAAMDGGGKCTYTAAVTGQAAVTRPCSIEEDLSNDVCQNECVRSGGDTMDTYFTSESLTSLGLTYNGTGDVDINTPEVLASQFKCGTGTTAPQPTLKSGTLPDIPANADTPLDLTTYLQCPSASPSGTPVPTPVPSSPGSTPPPDSHWYDFSDWWLLGNGWWFVFAVGAVGVLWMMVSAEKGRRARNRAEG